MAFRYQGVTTKRIYSFQLPQLTAPATTVTINGETCVPVNNDGSLARGYKGPTPPGDPYSFTVVPSTWEQQ